MMAAQIGKPLKSKGGIIPSNYSCYNKRHGLCENPFTSDSVLGPFILNYVANMYRIQRTFGKSTSIETLEKKLLRGEVFKEVDHIENKGLTQLYQALKNQIFAGNPVFYEPNLPEHEAAPDQKAIYLGEKASHERALHQLFNLVSGYIHLAGSTRRGILGGWFAASLLGGVLRGRGLRGGSVRGRSTRRAGIKQAGLGIFLRAHV
ncbi:hypothetical protein D5272_05260 [bacterium D16-76]|nr:hypothetical protein [bacterium D16-76]